MAKKVKGKHLHQYARENKDIELPQKSGEIYSISMSEMALVSAKNHKEKILANIKEVSGDFRQKEIIKQWENYDEKEFAVARITVEMSKGLYVRSLAQDICKHNNTLGFVSALIRTKNGKYAKENSKTLEEIFGPDFQTSYDFESKPNFK